MLPPCPAGQTSILRSLYASTRRYIFLRKAQADIRNGRVDPLDWQAISLPASGKTAILYVPIPKAANTSIRLALCETLGIDRSDVRNIHADKRIPKQSLKHALGNADAGTYCFSVIRHPADRIRSAYQNKILDQKTSFGPALRLGILKSDTFETFLRRIECVPGNTLDSHFRPQSLLLHYALKHPGFQIIKTTDLAGEWPGICEEFSRRGLIQPSRNLGQKNPSFKTTQHAHSDRERRLIQKIYAEDFEQFGFEW